MAEDDNEIEIVGGKSTIKVDAPPTGAEPIEKQAHEMRESDFHESHTEHAEPRRQLDVPFHHREPSRFERIKERIMQPLNQARREHEIYSKAFNEAKEHHIPLVAAERGREAARKRFGAKETHFGTLFSPASAKPMFGGKRRRGRSRVQKLAKADRRLLSQIRSLRGRERGERRAMPYGHEQERRGFGKQMTHPLATLTQPRQPFGMHERGSHQFDNLTQPSGGHGLSGFGGMRNPMGTMERRRKK